MDEDTSRESIRLRKKLISYLQDEGNGVTIKNILIVNRRTYGLSYLKESIELEVEIYLDISSRPFGVTQHRTRSLK